MIRTELNVIPPCIALLIRIVETLVPKKRSEPLKNTGLSELHIEQLQSACACVTFTSSVSAVAPGQSAELTLQYTPRKATQGLGQEVVTIYTNDLSKPTMNVTLQATVLESLASQSLVREQKSAIPFK